MMMHITCLYLLTLIYFNIICIISFDLQGRDCMTIYINMIYHIPKLYSMLTVSECIPCQIDILFDSLTNFDHSLSSKSSAICNIIKRDMARSQIQANINSLLF